MKSLYFFLVFILCIGFAFAFEESQFDFDYLAVANYSNINDSTYWNGHAWSDTRWLDIDGGNANQNIDIGAWDLSVGKLATSDRFNLNYGDAGAPPMWEGLYDTMIIENDNSASIQIFTPSDKGGGYSFSSPDGRADGSYQYQHALKRLAFVANSSIVLFLDEDKIWANEDGNISLGDSGKDFDDAYFQGELHAGGRSVIFSNIYDRSGDTMTGKPLIQYSGTLKSNEDYLVIHNTVSAADMDGTETSILARQRPMEFPIDDKDLGKITWGTETDWTNDASNDGYMDMYVVENGVLVKWIGVNSTKKVNFYGDVETSGNFIGDGSQLTNINHNSLSGLQGGGGEGSEFYHLSSVVHDSAMGFLATSNWHANNLIIGNYINLTFAEGNVTADYYFGDGSQLTGIASGNPFDQVLNTTSGVEFNNISIELATNNQAVDINRSRVLSFGEGTKTLTKIKNTILAGSMNTDSHDNVLIETNYSGTFQQNYNNLHSKLTLDGTSFTKGSNFLSELFLGSQSGVPSSLSFVHADDQIATPSGFSVGSEASVKGNRSSVLYGAYFKSRNLGTGNSLGFQGYGESNSGDATGVYAYSKSTSGLSIASRARPFAFTNRDFSYYGRGNNHFSDGVSYFYESQAIQVAQNVTNFDNTDKGSVWIEKYLEVDNMTYLDGGVNISSDVIIQNNAGYNGYCVNTTFVEGIAVSCND